MERLETAVGSMESGEAPLSDLVARYEEGARLLKLCRKRLEEAELKIQAVRELDGKMASEPISLETE
jgi:exodeoxyribonuclease VII small subunit